MYDRTTIRSHWPLLSYINKPVSSLKQRLESHEYSDIEPFLFYDPVKDEKGVLVDRAKGSLDVIVDKDNYNIFKDKPKKFRLKVFPNEN